MLKFKSMNKIKSFIWKYIYSPLQRFSVKLFYYLPIKKNKIVMLYDFGNGYADSPKYIAEKLKNDNNIKITWLVNKFGYSVPKWIKQAKLGRIKCAYELATAKVIVTTMKGRCDLKKKPAQYFVYIPHGQSGAKYVEAGALEKLSQGYIDGSKWHSEVSDLFLSSSAMQTKEMKDYFWCNCDIMELGLPRNDIFFNYRQEKVAMIKERLNITTDIKIVLYAPTFRDNGDNEVYDIDATKLLQALSKRFGGQWKLLVRLHPNYIWFGEPDIIRDVNVVNVTEYEDIQELLISSDILISDYSSTRFDFNLMKRPIFLYVKDIDEYQNMRGLKPWFMKVPFSLCKSNEELFYAIENYDEVEYFKKIDEFQKIYGSVDDGHASERVIEHLKTVMQ